MTDTRQQAIDLVTEAFAEQDVFTMDDLLGDLDMTTDFEPDPRITVENANYDFNYGAYDDACHDRTELPLIHGLGYAMTDSHDERLRNLAQSAVDLHRTFPSETIKLYDYEIADDGTALPPWNIHDPNQANVMRGLVASHPQVLHVLRGGYTYQALAQRIWNRQIPTLCNVNVSADCDIEAKPPRGWKSRDIWAIFTAQVGEFLVFFTICGPCFFKMWPMADGVSFSTFDPKHEPRNAQWNRGNTRRKMSG